ncbi:MULTISPECIES: hypothetical protein [Clostridium]|uniref:hypothetical protein n=1 Tax=Clostridium TaxID=1485 RepID=UPI0002F9EDD0|nr:MULTISPECIES: hypothetical protein [Clostridium]MBN1046050.1 hypothetical protein [Clostridium botulinum]MBN1052828.1 hypothetical protein [Clostridium botulinum]MBN1055990.1 hypothetical protein [Clostridium botulinum]NFN94724.1 hypothetical protein [Clostridium botulinum]NFR86420.1 hypothetical protein [Clostridium botulinum]
MSKKIKNRLKAILVFLICIILFVIHFSKINQVKEIEILTWENYYNENNIAFFYDDENNEKIKSLDNTYKVKEVLNESDKEIDKVLKSIDILNAICQYDDIDDLKQKSAYDIFKKLGGRRKVSAKDMAIIERDLLASYGFKSRVGAFKMKDAAFEDKYNYYVVEYWSNENNKWVMIDPLDKGYFRERDTLLSAIEVMTKEFNPLFYEGKTKEKEYKNNLKKYFGSYSIEIDNTIKNNKSNTSITYIKNEKALELKFKDEFGPPTIFTQETKLFEKSPEDNKVGQDEKAYLILMEKQDLVKITENNQGKDQNKDSIFMILGAFKDGKIMDEYYLSTNNSEYEKINKYKEIEIPKGETELNLSIDGVNVISKIILRKN